VFPLKPHCSAPKAIASFPAKAKNHPASPISKTPSSPLTNLNFNLSFAMSTTTPTPPPVTAPPLEKQTTVGNYFVSNYPPFSFWKKEDVGELLAALERPPKPGNPLGVYLHIPFCRKRCHFCYFRVYTDKDSAAIRNYIDATLQEMAIYAAKP